MDAATASALQKPADFARKIELVMKEEADPSVLQDVVEDLQTKPMYDTATEGADEVREYTAPTSHAGPREVMPAKEPPSTIRESSLIDLGNRGDELLEDLPKPSVQSVLSQPTSPSAELAPESVESSSRIVPNETSSIAHDDFSLFETYIMEKITSLLNDRVAKVIDETEKRVALVVDTSTRLARRVEILEQRLAVSKAPVPIHIMSQPERAMVNLPGPPLAQNAVHEHKVGLARSVLQKNRVCPPDFSKAMILAAVKKQVGGSGAPDVARVKTVPWTEEGIVGYLTK